MPSLRSTRHGVAGALELGRDAAVDVGAVRVARDDERARPANGVGHGSLASACRYLRDHRQAVLAAVHREPERRDPVASRRTPAARSCPGSCTAHIQLADARTAASDSTPAHIRLVSISVTESRAIAATSASPLSGCSPMAVTVPVVPKAEWATSA